MLLRYGLQIIQFPGNSFGSNDIAKLVENVENYVMLFVIDIIVHLHGPSL